MSLHTHELDSADTNTHTLLILAPVIEAKTVVSRTVNLLATHSHVTPGVCVSVINHHYILVINNTTYFPRETHLTCPTV